MSEKKLTLRQVEAKIKAVDESIGKLKDRLENLAEQKKGLQADKRKLTAAKTAAAKKAAAKKTTAKKTAAKPAAKKTTAKKTAAKKTTARKPAAKKTASKKPAAKKDDSLLGGLLEGLKDAISPEDLLKSILSKK